MIDGVIRTRVGYAGGLAPNPDYRHIGDHTETVQVDYDPERIGFAQLLGDFWESHDPYQKSGSGQYMRAVFYHDDAQKEAVLASKAALEERLGRAVLTKVAPLRSFTLAEDYHQKYLLKSRPELAAEMTRIYPRHADFVNSTAVARLNGYAGGYGSVERLTREIDSLGLSPHGRKTLTDWVQGRDRG